MSNKVDLFSFLDWFYVTDYMLESLENLLTINNDFYTFCKVLLSNIYFLLILNTLDDFRKIKLRKPSWIMNSKFFY